MRNKTGAISKGTYHTFSKDNIDINRHQDLKRSLLAFNATRVGGLLVISRKAPILTTRKQILRTRHHLLPFPVPKLQAPNANAQIAVKWGTSRPIKSNLYRLFSILLLTNTFSCNFFHGFPGGFDTNLDAGIIRLCPMLNGTMKQEENLNDSAFVIGAPAI